MNWTSKCPHCGGIIEPEKLNKHYTPERNQEETESEEKGMLTRKSLRSTRIR